MSDDRIDNDGRAAWRADVEKTLGKIHDRVTRVELRTGEALGIGGSLLGLLGPQLDLLKPPVGVLHGVLALLARARWPQYGEAIDAAALVLSGGAVALPERRAD